MRVLLTTIGSRGDVQPLVALAVRLTGLDQEVRVCAPPHFGEWIESLDIPFTPVGPELLASTAKASPLAAPPTSEQRYQMVADQLEAVKAAAEGCDAIVADKVFAARTVAELMGIRYIFAGYCPIVLPSVHHSPPVYATLAVHPADGTIDHRRLWDRDAQRWNDTWGAILNSQRASAGLAQVTDLRSHLLTDRPWLAADPTLAPWPI